MYTRHLQCKSVATQWAYHGWVQLVVLLHRKLHICLNREIRGKVLQQGGKLMPSVKLGQTLTVTVDLHIASGRRAASYVGRIIEILNAYPRFVTQGFIRMRCCVHG